MKVMGVALIFWGAMLGYTQFRRWMNLKIRLGRALINDLGILKVEVCIRCRALPVILERELSDGIGAEYLWKPLLCRITSGNGAVRECWEEETANLPEQFPQRMAPLGAMLQEGGEPFSRAVEEVREDLRRDLYAEESRSALSVRLAGALCFSGASILVLILL